MSQITQLIDTAHHGQSTPGAEKLNQRTSHTGGVNIRSLSSHFGSSQRSDLTLQRLVPHFGFAASAPLSEDAGDCNEARRSAKGGRWSLTTSVDGSGDLRFCKSFNGFIGISVNVSAIVKGWKRRLLTDGGRDTQLVLCVPTQILREILWNIGWTTC